MTLGSSPLREEMRHEQVDIRVHIVARKAIKRFPKTLGTGSGNAELRHGGGVSPDKAFIVASDMRPQPVIGIAAMQRHPWTNGQVERMNRTIKDATVKRFYYETHDELGKHLTDFVAAYNYARRLKTLRGLTPYEAICKAWAKSPSLFIADRARPWSSSSGIGR
jgi:hypothetical protein